MLLFWKNSPLFLSLDHTNYARWMPIHIHDIKALPEAIKIEFNDKGNFVLRKSQKAFSFIPFDQAHEQENKVVKGSGGAVGLTDNASPFTRYLGRNGL